MTARSTPPTIWSGTVWHERRSPATHRFRYRMWWADLDLDHLGATVRSMRLLDTRKARPLRFERSDYLGDPATDLATAVRDVVETRTGERPGGPVRLVGHLRTLGWCFNPIVLYLCHDDAGELRWVVADVTNTPWRERHQYVLPADPTGVHGHVEDKALHVSPFMGMHQRYRFDIDLDCERLGVRVTTVEGDHVPFTAGVDLTARPMTDRTLVAALARNPLLTVRVSLGIHTQAARLWRKRVPFRTHPRRHREEVRVP
jgi:uncharacterized protein